MGISRQKLGYPLQGSLQWISHQDPTFFSAALKSLNTLSNAASQES
jgi:hypothetical protein